MRPETQDSAPLRTLNFSQVVASVFQYTASINIDTFPEIFPRQLSEITIVKNCEKVCSLQYIYHGERETDRQTQTDRQTERQ